MLEAYVRVTGDDYARLGEEAALWVAFDGHSAFMRMVEGHCAALCVDPREGVFVCRAYETRPQTCRDLAREGPACCGEIATKGDRPALALRGRPRSLVEGPVTDPDGHGLRPVIDSHPLG
jgi:hypothetical protein